MKIVLGMIEAGGGHKSTAIAIQEALGNLLSPADTCECVDFAHHVGAYEFDLAHKQQWDALLKLSVFARVGYEVTDFFGELSRKTVLFWARDFIIKAAEWFAREQPDAFVPTHWLNAAAALFARKQYPQLKTKIYYYLCEPFDASSIHIWQGADAYLVGSEAVRQKLVASKIPENLVHVVGYAVRPSFFRQLGDREPIRKQLGLGQRLTILLSGGAAGVGKMAMIARRLGRSRFPINLIVVCGKNEALKRELDRMAKRLARTGTTSDLGHHSAAWKTRPHPRLIPFGYAKNMPQLIAACDIALLKAGPASTFEASFAGKPVIFFEHVARHEYANIEYVTGIGAGWHCSDMLELLILLRSLTMRPYLVEEASKKALAGSLTNASGPVARFIVDDLRP